MTPGSLPHPQSFKQLELLIHRSSVPPEGLPKKEVNKSLKSQPCQGLALALPFATRLPEAAGLRGEGGGRTSIARPLAARRAALPPRSEHGGLVRSACTFAPAWRCSEDQHLTPTLDALGQVRWPEPEPLSQRAGGVGGGSKAQTPRRSSTGECPIGARAGHGSWARRVGHPASRIPGAPRVSHPAVRARPALARPGAVRRPGAPGAARSPPPDSGRRCHRAGARVSARCPVPTSAPSAIPIGRASRDG